MTVLAAFAADSSTASTGERITTIVRPDVKTGRLVRSVLVNNPEPGRIGRDDKALLHLAERLKDRRQLARRLHGGWGRRAGRRIHLQAGQGGSVGR